MPGSYCALVDVPQPGRAQGQCSERSWGLRPRQPLCFKFSSEFPGSKTHGCPGWTSLRGGQGAAGSCDSDWGDGPAAPGLHTVQWLKWQLVTSPQLTSTRLPRRPRLGEKPSQPCSWASSGEDPTRPSGGSRCCFTQVPPRTGSALSKGAHPSTQDG